MLAMRPTNGVVYGTGWMCEPKFDGSRLLYYFDGDQVRLSTRSGRDVTHLYPEVAVPVGDTPMILDGELCALDDRGVPDFQKLQPRLMKRLPFPPVVYAVFDVLWFRRESTMDRTYEERRFLLESFFSPGSSVKLPESFLLVPSKEHLDLSQVVAAGFEGIVKKSKDGLYMPGKRSASWRKVTSTMSVIAAVGGYTPGKGSREGVIGALLLGLWGVNGDLVYVGAVGSGFTAAQAENIKTMLDPLRSENPFSDPLRTAHTPRLAEATFVKPLYAVEVKIKGWTGGTKMRHPVFKGFVDEIERATLTEQTGWH